MTLSAKPLALVIVPVVVMLAAAASAQVPDPGLTTKEGLVEEVDPRGRKLVVGLDDDTILKLRLTAHAAAEAEGQSAVRRRVIVYYGDDADEAVAHYFRVK